MICLQCTVPRPGETQHEAGIRLRDGMLRRFCGIDSPSDIGRTGEKPRLADRPAFLWSVRGVIFAVAVVCIVLGIVNGGMHDVLNKAIRICTECIGLG